MTPWARLILNIVKVELGHVALARNIGGVQLVSILDRRRVGYDQVFA